MWHKLQDIASRTKKLAHTRDIVDIIRKLYQNSTFPLFVVDAIGLDKLPRINVEDISGVLVADKLSDIIIDLSECVGTILLTSGLQYRPDYTIFCEEQCIIP